MINSTISTTTFNPSAFTQSQITTSLTDPLAPFVIQSDNESNFLTGNEEKSIHLVNAANGKTYAPFYYYNESRVEYPDSWPWDYHLVPTAEPSDQYQNIRDESHHLTDYANTMDDNLSKKIDFINRIDFSASRKSDLLQVQKLVFEAHLTSQKMSHNAKHVSTYYRIQLGKIASIFQKIVKEQKLGRWKEQFTRFFPNISYETVNIYMKVADIPGVDDWLFLGIWKLNKIRSAYHALDVHSPTPINALGNLLDLDFTLDFTEAMLTKLVNREKFKKSLLTNAIALSDEIVGDMTISDIDLNSTLLKEMNKIQNAGGDPKKHAIMLIANKGSKRPLKKTPSIPDQLAFEAQVGPLLDIFKFLLKTPAVDIKLDYTLLDELIENAIQLDKHLSRNIYQKAA